MSDYDALDHATLQQMLSEASTYEERSELRKALRKRKNNDVGSATTKPRGNSVYNRFAGSTATKKSTSVASYGVPVPPVAKDDRASPTTPTYKKATVQPSSPTPPPPVLQEEPEREDDSPEESTDRAPVATEPAEEEEEEEAEQADGEVEDEVPEGGEEEVIPEDEVEEVNQAPEDGDGGEVDSGMSPPSVEIDETTKSGGDEYPDYSGSYEPVGSAKELQHYLVIYVNRELSLNPPLPVKGKALYDTCSDPVSLCKLINKAVPGTVDMRALSKISGSSSQRVEAMLDNMTLVIESARAIGCRIHDTMQDSIMEKEPGTIKDFLVDLIRARVVHMPGMEDEPSSTFTDLDSLFEKLNISLDGQGEGHSNADVAKSSPSQSKNSTELTYEERAACRKAEREERLKKEVDGGSSVELTYEERAAQRKADRERRRREREALAK